MYRYLFGIAILLWTSLASAVVIEFRAEWDAVPDVDEYVLYACDEPIQQAFSDPLTDTPLVGSCTSSLSTYIRKGTSTTDTYRTSKNEGTVYFRVSTRKLMVVGDEVKSIESEMSEQVGLPFKSVEPPGKPGDLRVFGPLNVPVREDEKK